MSKLYNAPLSFWYGVPIVVLIAAGSLNCLWRVVAISTDPNAEMGGLLVPYLLVAAAILGAFGWLMFRLLAHKSRGSAWVYAIVTALVYGGLLAVLFTIFSHAKDNKMPSWAAISGFAISVLVSGAVYNQELRGR